MRGQSTVELLILVGAILMVLSSMLYIGNNSIESAVVMQAARDGAENAVASFDANYRCITNIDQVWSSRGIITITVSVRDGPAGDSFDNMLKENIRVGALKYIRNAIAGSFPKDANPVHTRYYTYDVTVDVMRVTK